MIINQRYIKKVITNFDSGQIVGLNPAGVTKPINRILISNLQQRIAV